MRAPQDEDRLLTVLSMIHPHPEESRRLVSKDAGWD